MSNHASTKLHRFPPVPAAKTTASTSQIPESGTPNIAIVALWRRIKTIPTIVPMITPQNSPI